MADLDETAKANAHATASLERVTDADGHHALRIVGEIDLAAAPGIAAAIDETFDAVPSAIDFDLSELRFMDSSGIAVFLALVERGIAVHITHCSPAVRRVLEVTGLTSLFHLT